MKFEKVSKAQFLSTGFNEYDNVQIPLRSTKGSAGYDFVTPTKIVIPANKRSSLIPTGIRCQIDDGYVLLLFVRSSIGVKKGLTLSNGTGVIDSDYYYAKNEGHIMFSLQNNTDSDIIIEAGERIMQGVFVPFGIVDDDNCVNERVGGFGSTDEAVFKI